jgi:glycosyltransferase involved in cell wall biosynthesis
MKLLFIANTSYNLYNFRLPLLKALIEKGYEITLVAPKDEYTPLLEKNFELKIIRNLDRKGLNPVKEISLLKELLTILKNSKPDLVINLTIKPNIWGNIAAQILKIPSIGIITGLGSVFTNPKFPIYQLVKTLYTFSLKHPKKVIFQNQEDAELFLREKIVEPSKIKVIPGSGVDLNYFRPVEKENKNSHKFIFGYAGRLLWDKGLKELVEAIKLLRAENLNFEVHLLGKPDKGNPKSVDMKTIRQWEEKGFITYQGFSKDVRPFLESIDCFIYPTFYREGIPRAILEAMAMKKPIITTKVPGCRELVIDDRNGFLVEPKNPKELAEAMKKMLNLPKQKVSSMGEFSYQLVKEKYSTDVVIPQYVEVIEEVLRGK